MRRLWPWLALLVCLFLGTDALAQDFMPSLTESVDTLAGKDAAETSSAVRLVVLLTGLSLLPGFLMLMSPFTRFIIVFSLLRQALGLQQTPPNPVLIALAVILSMVVMQPQLETVKETALEPYLAGEMETSEAIEAGLQPVRNFMFNNTMGDELFTAMKLAKSDLVDQEAPITTADVPTPVLVTAFVLSELKRAFTISVQLYIPFLVIDVVIASVLLGMGMMMLPPTVISLPFKLLVFVLMDGWNLLLVGLVGGFS